MQIASVTKLSQTIEERRKADRYAKVAEAPYTNQKLAEHSDTEDTQNQLTANPSFGRLRRWINWSQEVALVGG
jgi:type IV secretory pathway TrbF-like protein